MAMTGTVKFFNMKRGYGFVKPDGGGREVFVHRSAVERAGLKPLNGGERLRFDIELDRTGKGPKAVNLVLTLKPPRKAGNHPPELQPWPLEGCGRGKKQGNLQRWSRPKSRQRRESSKDRGFDSRS